MTKYSMLNLSENAEGVVELNSKKYKHPGFQTDECATFQ